jgi:prepilin-type N-terminal cleavage/methylation domain-containing protein
MARTREAGLTLIEILVVVAIGAFLLAATLSGMRSIVSSKSLDADAARVAAELRRARSLTLSSKYAKQYGVHLATSSVTLFEGSAYSSGSATNTITRLNSSDMIATTTIVGGASDIVFARLTGTTTQSGTITITRVATTSDSATVTIYPTGIVDIQ